MVVWPGIAGAAVGAGGALGGFLFRARWGGSTAMQELERTNRVLERALKEHEVREAALAADNAVLRAKTDVAVAIMPVLDALKAHEESAKDRSDKLLLVLDLVAERLGPERNGG